MDDGTTTRTVESIARMEAQIATLTRERDAAMQRAWAAAESRDGTRDALVAMTHERNEANRQRVVAHAALDAVAALLFVPLRDLGYERAKELLCDAVEGLYQERHAARCEQHELDTAEMRAERAEKERDAALAAVDAVRAEERSTTVMFLRAFYEETKASAPAVAAAWWLMADMIERGEHAAAAMVAKGGDRG